jgi:hypothetical protein
MRIKDEHLEELSELLDDREAAEYWCEPDNVEFLKSSSIFYLCLFLCLYAHSRNLPTSLFIFETKNKILASISPFLQDKTFSPDNCTLTKTVPR